jgi:hypothetical protein
MFFKINLGTFHQELTGGIRVEKKPIIPEFSVFIKSF